MSDQGQGNTPPTNSQPDTGHGLDDIFGPLPVILPAKPVDPRPEFDVAHQDDLGIVHACHEAIERDGSVFRRGRGHIQLQGDHGRRSLYMMNSGNLRRVLVDNLRLVKSSKKGGPRPAKFSQDIISMITSDPDRGLPEITSVVHRPFFALDDYGKIKMITEPGLHGTVYLDLPPDLAGLNVPFSPTGPQIDAAYNFIFKDVVGDFPFADEASKMVFLSALMIPFCRQLIDGPVPIHMIDAARPGVGKSLLGSVVSRITCGSSSTHTFPPSGDEQRKVFFSLALAGAPVSFFDNITGRLASGYLANLVTTGAIESRMLGGNEVISAPWNQLILMTANNPTVNADIARRIIWCNLSEPPEGRHFANVPLLSWVDEVMPYIVESILTLIQNWVVNNRRTGVGRLDSFESWVEVIGGILNSVQQGGLKALLVAQKELSHEADDDSATAADLFKEILSVSNGGWVRAKHVLNHIDFQELPDGIHTAQQLGIYLSKYRGRALNGLVLERNTQKEYRVIKAEHRDPGLMPKSSQKEEETPF